MNDPSDKPLKPAGDEALEARITAWVLGEASPFEAAELEKLCAADPALRSFERRMRDLCGLLEEDAKAGPDAEWRLPAGKREKVTDLLDLEEPERPVAEVKTNRYFARRILLAAAACLMISLMAYPLFAPAGRKASEQAIAMERTVDFMSSADAAGGGDIADDIPRKAPDSKYSTLWSNSPMTAKPPPAMPQLAEAEKRQEAVAGSGGAGPVAGKPADAGLATFDLDSMPADAASAPAAEEGGEIAGVFRLGGRLQEKEAPQSAVEGALDSRAFFGRQTDVELASRFRQAQEGVPKPAETPADFSDLRQMGELADRVEAEPQRAITAGTELRYDPAAVVPATPMVGRLFGGEGRAKDEVTASSGEVSKEILDLKPAEETSAAAEPFSTFSLHVSDASFKLAKAALERGEQPDPAGIRPEEFYNAFDYGDPAPGRGEPVACAIEQAAHPVLPQRNLLRIGIRTGAEGRGAATPLHLTLLLDSSGSMEREDRQAGMAMAVQQLAGLLKEGDSVSVIGFSRQPRLLVERLPGARAKELNAIIAQTPSEGGTNLEEGLRIAEELAKRQFNPAAQNRVVLFTDGAANLGDAEPETLEARVEGMRQQGIAFDAAGFGAEGLNDKLLERLTRNGNGRYYIVDRPEDADANFAKQLAGAFRPAAENVKVQVRFNPARVGGYKLIGFEEHRLEKEDFRNDAVDAAEMAAEEAGIALYQAEVLPGGEGEIGEVSVRFRDAGSGQMVERTWTIPYEAQAPAFDQAAPSIQLAGLAALTAEKLRKGPPADAIDFQQLGPVLGKVKARYPNSQTVSDLDAMIGKLR